MSDTFVLCSKCGEELDNSKDYIGMGLYHCKNCKQKTENPRIVTTEYLRGQEDENLLGKC